MTGNDANLFAARTTLLRLPSRSTTAGGVPVVGSTPERALAAVMPLPRRSSDRPLRVDVVGGGPVGLTFACTLRAMMGDQVVIRVHDPRWRTRNGRVLWRERAEGNTRREQVVTLQSNVWSNLPEKVKRRLFTEGRFGEMWPLGPDSPAERGRPRNLKIRWIEDCLLDVAQDVYGVELRAEAYEVPEKWDGTHVVAICDGARSRTRESLEDHFGTPDRDFYSINGTPLEETVLGIRVSSHLPDEYTVPLTVSQNRFLFNSLGGGFINMRLTAEEASEIVAIGENGPVECIERYSCTMRPLGDRFVCDRHRATFKPSIDPLSFLWPRIQDGIRFFGASPSDFLSLTSFTLGMRQQSRFTAQLAPNTWGFLLGDAANSLHFWPGRGLNTGVKSAQSLAATLRRRWQGRDFRSSDFSSHEGTMQQLQYREKSRAWTTMVMPDENGVPRGIEDRVRAGLEGPFDRQALVHELFTRVRDVKDRLAPRMGHLPNDQWYLDRINGLHVKTLKVMVETGQWITREIGGDEVSVNVEFPEPSRRDLPLTHLRASSLAG
ncbi:hypothetical protein [Umezawaea sp.]|uniref:hypothetical protein n=1 Tax=Umezawaea sp. TaxID=1955258 RepID=UPI002ED65A0C